MEVTSIVDFEPGWLYAANKNLVDSLLPQEWLRKMLPREYAAWAHLFAVGGMAIYAPEFQSELCKRTYVDESVCTWIIKSGKAYVIGDNGYKTWSYELPADCRWQAPRLCSLALRTCVGPVDGRADAYTARISNVREIVQAHASTNTVFRALLSLGRLYCPNVNDFLQSSPLP